MTSLNDNAALLLEAHRYLSSDMDAGEGERFEELLARDQAVRDALADVVLLEQALAAGGRAATGANAAPVAVKRATCSRRFSRRALLAWTGSFAALLVVAIAISVRFEVASSPLADASSGSVSDEDALTAALWTSITTGDEEAEELDESEGPELDQLDIPEWMFAAVEAGNGKRDASPFEPLDEDDEEETL